MSPELIKGRLPSGRWIFTIVAAIVFIELGTLSAVGLGVMLWKGALSVDIICLLVAQMIGNITLIANWYFNKQARKGEPQ